MGNPKFTVKFCEGQLVPHSHKDDVREFQYLNGDDKTRDLKSFLCSRCVAYDRNRGYILEPTFSEEE
jgi:hypothetical protein